MKFTEAKSKDELYTLWLLEEFKVRGVVLSYDYEPERFCLSGSISVKKQKLDKNDNLKTVNRKLFLSHSYKCDIKIVWNPEYKGVIFSDFNLIEVTPFFIAHLIDDKYVSYLEVKPEFDFNNMTRTFIINQKWVYDKYGVYIQLFKPSEFFKKYFIPERFKMTDKEIQERKINFPTLSFDEWLSLNTPKTDNNESTIEIL